MDETEQSRLAAPDARLPAAMIAAACLLFAFAYRSFLIPADHLALEIGVESWFFRPNQSGPVVVVVLASWLLYRRWPRIAALPAGSASAWLVGPVLAVGLAMFLWARYTSTPDLHAVSLALLSAGLVLLYRGVAGLRAAWLPIAFLGFAVPIPAPLLLGMLWKLQILTSQYAGWLLYLIGEPALVSGDQIIRATQTFQVIETCSGLRSIETLTMLTVTLIDLFHRRGAHAALLFFAAPAIAFALNGVRVLTLILNPHSEILGVHTLQGVAILLGGLMLVYWLDGLLERVLPESSGSRPAPPGARAEGTGAGRSRVERAAALLAVAAIVGVASVAGPVWRPPPRELPRLQAAVDAATERWPHEEVARDWMFQGSVRFGDIAHSKVRVRGEPIEIFVGTANLHRGGGSPLSPSTAFPGAGWHVAGSGRATLPDDKVVGEKTLRRGNEQLLVYHWVSGSSGLLAESLRAFLALDQSRFRRTEPLFVVRLSTPLDLAAGGTPEEARRIAEYRLARAYSRIAPILAEI